MSTDTHTDNAQQTLAEFMAKHSINVSFVSLYAKQSSEGPHKVWQLCYSGILTYKGKSEAFDYFAGYGNANDELREMQKRANRSGLGRFGLANLSVINAILAHGAHSLVAQDKVREVMTELCKVWKPKAENLLNCLSLDAQAGCETFADFCANFGYDEDSRKAEAIHRECQKTADKLRALLGRGLVNELNNCEQL